MNTYTLSYTVYFKDGSFSNRTTKVKRCYSELHAKVKLEKWLETKEPRYKRLEFNDDIINFFNNIFK